MNDSLSQLQLIATNSANEHGWKIVWCTGNDIVKDPNIIKNSRIFQDAILSKHEVLTVGEALVLCHSELSEALEAHRDDNKTHFAEEIADIVIRVLHICGDLKIDLTKAINDKMLKNMNRPHRHGRKNL